MIKNYKSILFSVFYIFYFTHVVASGDNFSLADFFTDELIVASSVTTEYESFFKDRKALGAKEYDKKISEYGDGKKEALQSFLKNVYSEDGFNKFKKNYCLITKNIFSLERMIAEMRFYTSPDEWLFSIDSLLSISSADDLKKLNDIRNESEWEIMKLGFQQICCELGFRKKRPQYEYVHDLSAFFTETICYIDRLKEIFEKGLQRIKSIHTERTYDIDKKNDYLNGKQWQFFKNYLLLVYKFEDGKDFKQREPLLLQDRKNIRLFFNNQFFHYAGLAKKMYQYCKQNESNMTDDLRNDLQQYSNIGMQKLDPEVKDTNVKDAFTLIGDEVIQDYRKRIQLKIIPSNVDIIAIESPVNLDLSQKNTSENTPVIDNHGKLILDEDNKKAEKKDKIKPKKIESKKRSHKEMKKSDIEKEDDDSIHAEKKVRRNPTRQGRAKKN